MNSLNIPSSKLDWNCEEYLSMWIDCNSWRNKLHEYYVQGEWPSCKEWKVNHQNCELWKTQHDRKAQEALIRSDQRRLNSPKYDSPPIWKLRTEQCSDWKTKSVHSNTQSSSRVS